MRYLLLFLFLISSFYAGEEESVEKSILKYDKNFQSQIIGPELFLRKGKRQLPKKYYHRFRYGTYKDKNGKVVHRTFGLPGGVPDSIEKITVTDESALKEYNFDANGLHAKVKINKNFSYNTKVRRASHIRILKKAMKKNGVNKLIDRYDPVDLYDKNAEITVSDSNFTYVYKPSLKLSSKHIYTTKNIASTYTMEGEVGVKYEYKKAHITGPINSINRRAKYVTEDFTREYRDKKSSVYQFFHSDRFKPNSKEEDPYSEEGINERYNKKTGFKKGDPWLNYYTPVLDSKKQQVLKLSFKKLQQHEVSANYKISMLHHLKALRDVKLLEGELYGHMFNTQRHLIETDVKYLTFIEDEKVLEGIAENGLSDNKNLDTFLFNCYAHLDEDDKDKLSFYDAPGLKLVSNAEYIGKGFIQHTYSIKGFFDHSYYQGEKKPFTTRKQLHSGTPEAPDDIGIWRLNERDNTITLHASVKLFYGEMIGKEFEINLQEWKDDEKTKVEAEIFRSGGKDKTSIQNYFSRENILTYKGDKDKKYNIEVKLYDYDKLTDDDSIHKALKKYNNPYLKFELAKLNLGKTVKEPGASYRYWSKSATKTDPKKYPSHHKTIRHRLKGIYKDNFKALNKFSAIYEWKKNKLTIKDLIPEVSRTQYTYIHEFGHYLGLDHPGVTVNRLDLNDPRGPNGYSAYLYKGEALELDDDFKLDKHNGIDELMGAGMLWRKEYSFRWKQALDGFMGTDVESKDQVRYTPRNKK